MIITRTPVRISLLGGGTDFPHWYEEHGGVCVGGSIDKYSYISLRNLPPYQEFKSRFVYSEIETVLKNSEVNHKAIHACLSYMNRLNESGLEISHMADLPSKSGTGSSSTFVVGLLHALATYGGTYFSAKQLARAAICVEREIMQECVGCQDQFWASFGGFNFIRFQKDGEIQVYPLAIPHQKLQELESHLMLVFTGISRKSSDVAKSYIPTLTDKKREQYAMMKLAEDGISAIYKGDWFTLGELLNNAWFIKRGLGDKVSNPEIDHIYATARIYGVVGGKITGTGGGGCMVLLLKHPSLRSHVQEALVKLGCVPIDFKFEHSGSRVIFHD